MNQSLTLIILSICVGACLSTTLWVDPSGTDTETCSQSEPCASIQAALTVFGNSTSDLDLIFSNSTFPATGNTDIDFPNVDVTLDGSAGLAKFSCENFAGGFSGFSSLSAINIQVSDCQYGIYYNSTNEVTVSGSTFDGGIVGIFAVNATKFTVEDSTFTGNQYSILFVNDADMDTLDITNNVFSYGLVTLAVSDSNDKGTISGNTASGGDLFDIYGGEWKISQLTASDCDTAVTFNGNTTSSSLDISGSSFSNCNTGVMFSGYGLDIEQCDFMDISPFYAGISAAIYVTDAATIEIEESSSFHNVDNPLIIDVTTPFLIEIKDSTFNVTGSISGSVNPATNGTITNCQFTDGITSIVLDGGAWGITQCDFSRVNLQSIPFYGGALSLAGLNATFDITDCTFTNMSSQISGGAMYVNEAAVAIDSCTFTECSSTSGGAIYAETPDNFSIKDSTFTGNDAINDGGGIEFESDDISNLSVSMDNVAFTNNMATNGAAVSCCSESFSGCNITLVYVNENSVTLSNNTNTLGGDSNAVTCTVLTGAFDTAASEPDVDISSSGLEWWAWMLIALAVTVVLVIIIAVIVAGIMVYKKKRQQDYTQL